MNLVCYKVIMSILTSIEPYTGVIIIAIMLLTIVIYCICWSNRFCIDNICDKSIKIVKKILCFNCCKSCDPKNPTKYDDVERR